MENAIDHLMCASAQCTIIIMQCGESDAYERKRKQKNLDNHYELETK